MSDSRHGLINQEILVALSNKLGGHEFTHRGWVNFTRCPLCGNAKRKFGLDPSTNIASCFRCQDTISLSSLMRRLGLRTLRTRDPVHIEVRPKKQSDEFEPINLSGFQRLPFVGQGYSATSILGYARERHVDPDLWEIGVNEQDDRLLGRMIWIFRENGIPVYYQARSVMTSSRLKTINPLAGEGCPRGQAFFGHDLYKAGMELVVTEGPFDAAAVTDLDKGRLGTCTLGVPVSPKLRTLDTRKLNPHWVKTVHRLGIRRIAVFGDRDASASWAIFSALLHRIGLETRLVLWPKEAQGKDPGDLGPEGCDRALREWSEPVTDATLVRLLARG